MIFRVPNLRRLALAASGFALAVTSLPAVSLADPPPWAPAHGWRKKHHHDEDEVVVVRPAPRRDCGGIDNQAIGSTGGAAAGAILGNVVGRGSDERLVGAVAGAAGGALLGGVVGQSSDRRRGC